MAYLLPFKYHSTFELLTRSLPWKKSLSADMCLYLERSARMIITKLEWLSLGRNVLLYRCYLQRRMPELELDQDDTWI